ncbi:MAG: hypothetical protein R3F43_19860 [bacterium]
MAAAYTAWLEAFPEDVNRLAVLQNLATVLADAGRLRQRPPPLEADLLGPGASAPAPSTTPSSQYRRPSGPTAPHPPRACPGPRGPAAGGQRAADRDAPGRPGPPRQVRHRRDRLRRGPAPGRHRSAHRRRLRAPRHPGGDAAVRLVLDAHKRRDDWLGLDRERPPVHRGGQPWWRPPQDRARGGRRAAPAR